jgi:hypothetical protein
MAGLGVSAMSNTNRVDMYVSDSMLNRIENEAEDANKSRSKYLRDILQGHWDDQDLQRLNDDLQLEEKVERIAADARDELTRIAESVEQRNNDVADMTARAGVYSIANYEMLKTIHTPSEKRKKKSLLIGSRRLREPLDDHADFLNRNEKNGQGEGDDPNSEKDDILDPTELDEYGLHPDEEYYDIKREEEEYYEAEENNRTYLYNRDDPTARELDYLESIDEDQLTDHQEQRKKRAKRQQAARERKAEEWKEERAEIHWQARQEHKRRNSGLSGIFR